MKIIKFRKLADKIRNEQWSDQRIKALETLFIHFLVLEKGAELIAEGREIVFSLLV